jgi:hypothetical protein
MRARGRAGATAARAGRGRCRPARAGPAGRGQGVTPQAAGHRDTGAVLLQHLPDRDGALVSRFPVLPTPVTSAPRDLAICTAKVPIPPEAPLIRTFCPGCSRPASRRPCRAVVAASGTAAARSNVRLAGLRASASSAAQAYSPMGAPLHQPNTSSPGRNCVTSGPIASTYPATSVPRNLAFGPGSSVWACGCRWTNGTRRGARECAGDSPGVSWGTGSCGSSSRRVAHSLSWLRARPWVAGLPLTG